MEDDIRVDRNPNLLSILINKLDSLTGKTWDILYTDVDDRGDTQLDMEPIYPWVWRPDLSIAHIDFGHRKYIGDDFIKINFRSRTHSMIIRRSGMKKVIDYIEKHRMFTPLDDEIHCVPNIQLYMLKYSIVSFGYDGTSNITID